MSDSPWRSAAKTVSWRIAGSGATFAIGYTILGDFAVSGTIAIIQLTVNTVLYFIHERIWNHVRWGRR